MILENIHYPMDVIEIDDTMISTDQDPPEFPEDMPGVHGGLICYDTTNRDSMDCLPDLLNAYVSRNIPSYLVGLKADLSSLRQVDTELGKKLGNLFGVEVFEVDAFSEEGIKQMKNIYSMLVKRCIQEHGDDFVVKAPSAPSVASVENNNKNAMCGDPRQRRGSSSSSVSRQRLRKRVSGVQPQQHKERTSVDHDDQKNGNGVGEVETEAEHVRRSSFSSDTSYNSDYRFPSLSSKKTAASTAETSKTVTGFVYAPTTTVPTTMTATMTNATALSSPLTPAGASFADDDDDEKSSIHSVVVVPIERKSSLHDTPYAKKGLAASRRGSKDSWQLSSACFYYSESMGTGLTVDDIIDKLLAADPPRSDEHIATIFITFFRRFMKPAELARALIDRFDSDGLIEPPPTRLQERIQAIFLIWLNSYWNDFHSKRTRKIINTFLNRIAKERVLRPISDSLRPLMSRMPPVDDPDSRWGMFDEDGDVTDDGDDIDMASDESDSDDDVFEECEPPPTPPKTDEEKAVAPTKNKKDSGYASDTFSVFSLFGVGASRDTRDRKSISEGCKIDPPSGVTASSSTPLKRTSSTGSFNLFGRSRKSSISSSFGGFLFSLSPMTAVKQPNPAEPEQVSHQWKAPEEEASSAATTLKVEKPPVAQQAQDSHRAAAATPKSKKPRSLSAAAPVTGTVNATTPPPRPKSPAMSMSSSTRSIRRQSTAETPKDTPATSASLDNNAKHGSRAEFAGGLINIDLYCCMSTSPSWASFGTSTVASSTGTSFRSNFGSTNKDKDPAVQHYKMMMEMPDQSIAAQLTWIEAELFGKIKAREFVRNIWSSHSSSNGRPSRPNSVSSEEQIRSNSAVVASIAHFNFISGWVATMIVTQAKTNKRAALLGKFMSIAVELRNHNNYNSLMAVLAGLNSAPVLRLKQTREAVKDKKIYKQFQSLERLMSSDRSFSSYRLALKASEAPGIPYLGIHNQDLVSLAEGNKDFRADGTVHWDKFRLMGECLVNMLKFQCPAYDIEPDGRILRFIADSEILSEDEQYKRSNMVEPRLKSSSTNRLRDLWLRM
ncbi:ras guanine nucleotide exchange factor domain-containing protein [Dichotomocladium elegans]|nr:ras guanine nucleotide exchange factor domain-containing protein [Dichotomocladium elegans]